MTEPVRIMARRIPWPDLSAKPNRSGLRLRWDALTEAGELLVAATERPLADGAQALALRGLHPETLVTIRHDGSPHDSFAPMPLRIPAARGARRAEERARIAAQLARGSQEKPAGRSALPEVAPDARGAPVSHSMPESRESLESRPTAGGGR
jgi:hypothetical protein